MSEGAGSPTSSPRLLVYCQDGRGLGHLRRTSSLAHEFLRVRPGACVLTISDSPLGTFFGLSPNQDFLKLPSIVKTGAGRWHGLSLPIPSAELVALRRDLIRSVAVSFRPDILLVDHMPHGATGELLPTLEVLRLSPTALVLGLRDIIDAPHVVRHRWQVEGAYEAVERHYDLVLVYGTRDVFDVAEQYQMPPAAASRFRYCGYVCTPETAHDVSQVRARCLAGQTDDILIVAMAGGGDDAYPVMDALLHALPKIRAEVPAALTIVTGPFMPAALQRDLQARAQTPGVEVLSAVRDVPSYIEAADVIVGMAGYNTTTEVLRARTPAVLVPRAAPSAEQRMRARLFAERGWVHVVDPDELTPPTLARAVLDALRRGRAGSEKPGPDLDGLPVAVDRLVALLDRPAPAFHDGRRNGVPRRRPARDGVIASASSETR